jgi:hypothetical protein
VVRSVRPLGLALLAASALSGCVSTQTKNARTLVINERTLDAQSSLRVTRINPRVAVTTVALIRSRRATALVVRLRNLGRSPLSDLPISVGVLDRSGHRQYLNRGINLPYFNTHVASLGGSSTALWVLTIRSVVAPGSRPFAHVGLPTLPASTTAATLPRIEVLAAHSGRGLRLAVLNRSGVPQYDLQVYAAATPRGRYVAAGRASLAALDGGGRAHVGVRLLGAPSGAQVLLSAPPTIFN